MTAAATRFGVAPGAAARGRFHRSLPVLVGLAVGLLLPPSPACAQSAPTVVAIPHLGFGPIVDHGDLVSFSANLLLEVEVGAERWRGSAFGGVRGIGAACADGCDLSGESVGVGVAYALRSVTAGVGFGLLHQGSAWYPQPYLRVSYDRGAMRLQLRVEAPRGGYGLSMPLLVGVRLPLS